MNQREKELIDRCIESHYNMIRMHRRAIIELSTQDNQRERVVR